MKKGQKTGRAHTLAKGCKLKNGLSLEQVDKAKELLARVNVAKICEKRRVNVSTIYNVLRDESPRVDLLNKVLHEANREVKKQEQTLAALPL